jgi:hypothetical protein
LVCEAHEAYPCKGTQKIGKKPFAAVFFLTLIADFKGWIHGTVPRHALPPRPPEGATGACRTTGGISDRRRAASIVCKIIWSNFNTSDVHILEKNKQVLSD